jgi:hypothetical protein
VLNEALRIKLQHERLGALLAQMDAEFGPVPARELERAMSSLPKSERGASPESSSAGRVGRAPSMPWSRRRRLS